MGKRVQGMGLAPFFVFGRIPFVLVGKEGIGFVLFLEGTPFVGWFGMYGGWSVFFGGYPL